MRVKIDYNKGKMIIITRLPSKFQMSNFRGDPPPATLYRGHSAITSLEKREGVGEERNKNEIESGISHEASSMWVVYICACV